MTKHSSFTSFSQLPISSALIQVVEELGFKEMTPIQAESIPLLLEGKDVIGQSKTGSGKTAAFSIPVLHKIQLQNKTLQTLVLCPTRELCTQVAREIRRLGRRHPGLQVLTLSGGQPIFPQLQALEKGVHIVVGTPGRVLDHLRRGTLILKGVSTLVLDEADRMLEMGFEEDMQKILDELPTTRQTVLFSATFPREIEALSRTYQKSPVRVTIQDVQQTAPNIRQTYYEVPLEQKPGGLIWLFQQIKPESCIVFCNFKATTIDLARNLANIGVSSNAIHGDLEQNDRDRIMAKFRNKSIRVLVATDVAARGIDVENLDAVINFEIPKQEEVYVHRIGRTGRAGKQGIAVSLVTTKEKHKIAAIEKYSGQKIEPKKFPNLENFKPEEAQVPTSQEAAMATLYISGGRKDKMRPGDILGALTGEAGRLKGSDTGKIEIHDRFSYVAISKSVAQIALKRLRDGRIKGRKFRVELVR